MSTKAVDLLKETYHCADCKAIALSREIFFKRIIICNYCLLYFLKSDFETHIQSCPVVSKHV